MLIASTWLFVLENTPFLKTGGGRLVSARGPTSFRRVRTKHILKTAVQTKQNAEFQ